jgi:hypothetical protein
MRRTTAIAGGMLLALALASCGGGSETKTVVVTSTDTATTAAPLSKPEFIAKADAICQSVTDQTRESGNRANAALQRLNYKVAATSVEEELAVVRDGNAQQLALQPPRGDEEVVGKINEMRQEAVALLDRLLDALKSEDGTRVDSLSTEFKSVTDKLSGIDTGYGFKVCGKD